jgi:hypothetical protein
MTPYTTDDLITSVKDRGMIPDASSGSLSSAALLQFGSEELQGPLMQLITSAREKYYETYTDTALTANQAVYSIPARAAGGVVSVVQYIYNNCIYVLVPIDPSEASTTNTGLVPIGYYFQNNSIVVFPTPNVTQGTLRMRYFQRPSRLEQTTNCAKVSSFDPIALTVTVATIPSSWATGTVVDFIPSTLPYTPYSLETSLAGVTGTVITLTAVPSSLAIGDYIALAGFTPIPEVPYEFFQVLAQMIVCKALEAVGDPKLSVAQAGRQAYSDSALKMITPRDKSTAKKVVSNWRSF